MKIDGAINYASFMQHFHPIGTANEPAQDVNRADRINEVAEVGPVKEDEGQIAPLTPVYSRAQAYDAANGREALEDITVDFDDGTAAVSAFQTAGIRQAISEMEKDSVLHEYQYFVGNRRPETIVDNADGVVTRLADAVA